MLTFKMYSYCWKLKHKGEREQFPVCVLDLYALWHSMETSQLFTNLNNPNFSRQWAGGKFAGASPSDLACIFFFPSQAQLAKDREPAL